ncbi:hypothetical protein IscW_ISCW000620 [Ixodes scapularis]|uniref:Uncharacterized protein n=1 Tax=Ixodes scapularis TaxID=6945 RepID=B7P1C7_IXOSC|nr:hypothetical protein IscW_ISCW000620 [Ixodes scapularis]|eukprot:XP_002433335.1 hypothetical protein IscW_ISCW000620 [Ixodes scapularis]
MAAPAATIGLGLRALGHASLATWRLVSAPELRPTPGDATLVSARDKKARTRAPLAERVEAQRGADSCPEGSLTLGDNGLKRLQAPPATADGSSK